MARESTHPANGEDLCASYAEGTARVDGSMTVASVELANRVFLAPLSGISDVPFRRLARRFGAGAVVSEMVASAEFANGHPESNLRAMRDGDGAHIVQLAGRDPTWMRAAAERLEASGVDIIDINMGCPAKKVVGGLSGSALMREPDLALKIIEATVAGAGRVPVTLKMRLGWDAESINAPEIARRAEAAGVCMVTVHGRTRVQFYTGNADWDAIRAVSNTVRIPVVANGDLVDSSQVSAMLARSGADAVMIGRGAQGRPWLPGLVAGYCDVASLSTVRLADLIEEHYSGILAHYGTVVGLRAARKHLGWYVDRFLAASGRVSAADRTAMMTAVDGRSVVRLLRHMLADVSVGDVEGAPRAQLARAA